MDNHLDARLQALATAARATTQAAGATTFSSVVAVEKRSLTGGAVLLDGREQEEFADLSDDAWDDATSAMMSDEQLAGKVLTVSIAGAGEPVEITYFDAPGSSDFSSWTGMLRVGRKRKGPPPAVALTEVVADNDLAEIERLLRERGHGKGFTEKQIAAAEKKRKVAFPPELRLFFSLVKQGVVLGDEDGSKRFAEVVDGLAGGTLDHGNVVDPQKRILSPDAPLPPQPAPSPDDVVQPLLATPGWVVFAGDGGGNDYALDLVPGPKGRIGQVVQFDHETFDPPVLVAHSLTDFLAGRRAKTPRAAKRKRIDPRDEVLSLTSRLKSTATDEELQAATRLYLGPLAKPFDFGRLAGSRNLRELEIDELSGASVPDLRPLRTLTALEHLKACPEVWEAIAEQDAWPPALITALVCDADAYRPARIDVANRVLEHYGRPPAEVHTWRG